MRLREDALDQIPATVRDCARWAGATLLASEPRVRIFAFGSRASGLASPRSDVDVGIDLSHPVPPALLDRMREAFANLPILQKVDVVDFSRVEPEFGDMALRRIEVLYERTA